MLKSVLITGANAGLGKESARQLALQEGMERVYLGCRNEAKAKVAKAELEASTGKSIFDIVILDVSKLDTVRTTVASLKEPVDALVMNAGGPGGANFHEKTSNGVTRMFAINVLGHVVLAEELLKAKKLTKVAIYSGSEAARGIKEMGMKAPTLQTSSVDEFASIADGSFFGEVSDSMVPYGPIKYMGALWMSSLARKYPNVRFVTMSPGATSGTNIAKSGPLPQRIMAKVAFAIMRMFGKAHSVEVGAKRYVDALIDDTYKTGLFYASQSGITGPVSDQGTMFAPLYNQEYQENAYQAIHRFIQ